MKFNTTLLAGALCAGLFTSQAEATIVTLETSVGNIDINLYDETTPLTVANFLAYVNTGAYDHTFIHRSIPGFVVQGGGFVFNTGTTFDHIETLAPVVNEPVYSNVRGTISMAKPPNSPNGATSEFFFNLVNNDASSANNLDLAESGYTVFGQLTDESMAVVDAIAGLQFYAFTQAYSNSALGNLPLQNYTDDSVLPTEDNFIIIHSATVSDAATDTAAGFTPPVNPGPAATPTPPTTDSPIDSGGGNMGLFSLMLLTGAGLMRRRVKPNPLNK